MRTLISILISLMLSTGVSAQQAAGTFHILKEPFTIPQLERSRTVRIYLPPAYNDSNQRFPVMYMHDAQNLFDKETAFAGEWQVDESLNELSKTHNLQLIVVGIDNGAEHRTTELSAWSHERYGEAEGKQYTNFIVNTVKPYIDKHYRTQPEKQHTAIMGSSMGGLSSHYAIYAHPETFSKAGIFSPSYWYSDAVVGFTQQRPLPAQHRLYFIVGEEEGEDMVSPMNNMVATILDAGHPAQNVYSAVIPEGKHNEAFWSAHFKQAVTWLFQAD